MFFNIFKYKKCYVCLLVLAVINPIFFWSLSTFSFLNIFSVLFFSIIILINGIVVAVVDKTFKDKKEDTPILLLFWVSLATIGCLGTFISTCVPVETEFIKYLR